MMIQWTEDLAVGVEEIDNQHKELFSRIDKLFDACKQGKELFEVRNIIKFLEDYVIEHFNAEETLQIETGYPDFVQHKAQHNQFIEYFSDLKEEFEREGVSRSFELQLKQILVDWLTQHIGVMDKEIGSHLTSMK